MGSSSDSGGGQGQEPQESYGVLVGWSHRDINGRLDLKLQTTRSTRRGKPGDPDAHHVILTRSQAAVLANYLLQIADATPPRRRRRGIFGKLLEG